MDIDNAIDDYFLLEEMGLGNSLMLAAAAAHKNYYASVMKLLEALGAAIRSQGAKEGPPRSDAARALSFKRDGYKLIVGWKYKTALECWPDMINGQWIIQPNTRKYVNQDGNSLPLDTPLNDIAAMVVDFFVNRYKRFNTAEDSPDQMELLGEIGDS